MKYCAICYRNLILTCLAPINTSPCLPMSFKVMTFWANKTIRPAMLYEIFQAIFFSRKFGSKLFYCYFLNSIVALHGHYISTYSSVQRIVYNHLVLCRSLSSLIRRVFASVMADIKKIRFSLLSIGLSFHIDYANEFSYNFLQPSKRRLKITKGLLRL